MKAIAIFTSFLFSFSLQADELDPVPAPSKACKELELAINKKGKPTTDEDFQRIGTRLPADVHARARKRLDNGEKLAAVREIRACLKTGLMESKRIVELLP